jgi:DNA topoisomerase 2-associated protein PAT1
MNLNNLDDLDALLESKYENDLEDQILEFEEGNGDLDSLTFGLVDSNSIGTQQPLFNTLQHSREPTQPRYQPLLQQQPQMQNFQQMLNMPLNQNIGINMHQNIQHNVPLNIQNMMPQHGNHSQMPQPLHRVQPLQTPQGMVSVPGMMTMEDVENLLKSQSVQAQKTMGKESQIKEKVMTVEDVESLLKAQLSLPSENKSLPSQVSEEKKEAPKEKEILSVGKEKKNRVHLEKIKRPSQAERRKNKNVDQEFFRKDSRDSREEKKKIKVFIMNWEKELIAKIQISQLVTDDPMRDDFYCQIYTQNSSARKESMQKKERGKKKSAGANKIQQQMTRLIEKRKTKEVKESSNFNLVNSSISRRSSRKDFCDVFQESETSLVFRFNLKTGKIKS